MIQNDSILQNTSQQIIQIENVNEPQVNFFILKGAFIFMITALIALIIISIIAITLNQTQSQIITMGSLIIVISIFPTFSYLYLLVQIITTQNIIERKINDEFYLNQKTYQSTSGFFVSYTGQSKFYPIRYQFIYAGIALILLVQNFLPTQSEYCNDSNEGNYQGAYKNDENSNQNCQYINYDALYQGPILKGYARFTIFISVLILLFEFLRTLLYFYQCHKIKYQLIKYEQSVQNIDPEQVINVANNFLSLSLFYSLAKLTALVIIAFYDQNQSSKILIGSNIYFHSIMIIASERYGMILTKSPKLPYINAYKSYMIILEQLVFQKNCRNIILFTLLILSLPLCIVGMVLFNPKYNNLDIINFDNYVRFDCGIMHLFACVLIGIYYFSLSCNKTQTNLINNQQVQQETVVVNQQQPFYQNQQQQYQQQQYQSSFYQQYSQPLNQNQYIMPQQREITQPITQPDQKVVSLPPVEQKGPYFYNIKLLNNTDCTICLQAMIQDSSEKIVQLKCHNTHIFHQKCINEWLYNHKKCPICNTQF